MSLIERFTRDSASKYVWSVLALLAAIGLVYAVIANGEALEAERTASEARAVRHVKQVLVPLLNEADLKAPLTGQKEVSVRAEVGDSILADPRVARVRIWSAAEHGTLLFSTDDADRPGTKTGFNDALLRETSREGTQTLNGVSDTGGADDPERTLLRTYVPIGPGAVVEIDQTNGGTLGPIQDEWRSYELVAVGALLFLLILTGLSLREPIEPLNVGVPFAATSVPRGYSLIDNDRLAAVEEVYRLADERVARLQGKLAESEEARRRLEASIQQTLSKATATRSVGAAPEPVPVEPVPEEPAPAARASLPELVEVPESEIVTSPHGEKRAAAPAGPLARAARDQKPYEQTPRRAKPPSPAKKRPKRRQRKHPPQAQPKVAAESAPPAQAAPVQAPQPPEPAPAPPTRTSQPRPEAQPAPASEPAPGPAFAAREVAAVGAKASKSRNARATDPDLEDARAHEAALETFIRLTESDRQPHEAGEVDQGAVRAALARTAARKKPGGEGLHRPGTGPQERQGGPPPSERD